MAVKTVQGTCHHDCPDSCGWVVTVEASNGDRRAIKLRGNPDHPYSKGELCPKVNRFLDRVYHPDRILHPMARTGSKGDGAFKRVSWDEALQLVSERLHEVIDKYGGESILPWWDAGTQGLIQMSSLDRRFFARLGASRLTGSLCGGTARTGVESTYGSGRTADPMDIRFSRFIVLWGTNTRLTNRHLWAFIEQARSQGAQVVSIDPVRTITAGSSDWFIQPLPGTDVALMLAVMNVLIAKRLVDQDYVNRFASGYAELADRVAEWPPERAAQVCGLDVDEIVRFAVAYGMIRPSFIRTLIGAEHREHGAMFYRTLSCLPVLTGAWRERGGGLSRSVGSWFDDQVNESAFDVASDARQINMNHLGRVLTDPAMGIHALFVWNGNPVVSVPSAAQTRTGLRREDLFTVVSEQFMTDTALFADIVFPATTEVEQLDVIPSWGHLYLGWNEAAIAPQGESVPNTELWRRLAAAMGFDDPEFSLDDEGLIRSALRDVDVELLRRQGWVRLDLAEDLRPYADGGFATPSGKAELYSESLQRSGHDPLPSYAPGRESPTGDSGLFDRFPLALITPKHHARFLNSSYSHMHSQLESGPFVELDPEDAARRGISDGDLVAVWNDRAELRLPAKLSSRLRPGVVVIPWGWWGEDANANALTNDTLTDWGGGVAYSDTLVEVRKALV
jgi:anaerobic selenocysteine-containing dehydrogenase